MDDVLNRMVAVGAALLLAFTIWWFMWADPPHNIGTDIAIPTTAKPVPIRGPNEPDATATFTYVPTGDVLTVDLFHDQLLLRPGQLVKTNAQGQPVELWRAHVDEYRFGADPGLDLGLIAALETGPQTKGFDRFDLCLRVGFVRYLHNRFSPDLIISQQAIGGGLGFFPDPNSNARYLRHVGVEVGYVYTPHDDHWRLLLGVSTEWKF